MEEASFLTRFASSVTLVHRRDELRASKIMQDRARDNSKVAWALNRTPLEVTTGESGVKGLTVRNNETGQEELIEADGVFVAIGHTPNTGFLGGQITTDTNGYIVVTLERQKRTFRVYSLVVTCRIPVTVKRFLQQALAAWQQWMLRNT